MVVAHRHVLFDGELGFPDEAFDCQKCKHDASYRRDYGCDAPVEESFFAIPCFDCPGSDPGCATCHGSGREQVHRCPNVGRPPWVSQAIWLHGLWPDRLPHAGGLYNQPARYVAAMQVCDRAKAMMDRVDQRKMDRETHG